MKDVLAVLTPSLGDDLGQGANYALALASVTRSHLTLLITEIERGHHHGLQGEPDNMQGGTEMISPQSRLGRRGGLLAAQVSLSDLIVSTHPTRRY